MPLHKKNTIDWYFPKTKKTHNLSGRFLKLDHVEEGVFNQASFKMLYSQKEDKE